MATADLDDVNPTLMWIVLGSGMDCSGAVIAWLSFQSTKVVNYQSHSMLIQLVALPYSMLSTVCHAHSTTFKLNTAGK
jgi:hypothetical protein